MKSEYGSGYATCLLQFVNHGRQLNQMVELTRHTNSIAEDSVIRIWANGASDHLYGLVRPLDLADEDWHLASSLAAAAIDLGHGRGLMWTDGRTWKMEDGWKMIQSAVILLVKLKESGREVTSLDTAMEVDQAMGLEPDRGAYACTSEE